MSWAFQHFRNVTAELISGAVGISSNTHPLVLVCARYSQLSIMESLIAYDSDKSYVQEDVEAPFTLTLPYVPFHTGSSSSSSGDDNSVELLSDLQTTSDEK